MSCVVQVSGGPVYVSDRPGAHDFDLLKRCVLPDGTVLLAAQPGRPTADCLFVDVMRDSRSLLKACMLFWPFLCKLHLGHRANVEALGQNVLGPMTHV